MLKTTFITAPSGKTAKIPPLYNSTLFDGFLYIFFSQQPHMEADQTDGNHYLSLRSQCTTILVRMTVFSCFELISLLFEKTQVKCQVQYDTFAAIL